MRVLPEVAAKTLDQCKAGELVRPHFYGTGALALVAEHQSRRFLVMLKAEGLPQPSYINMESDFHARMLSYGNDYQIRVDHKNEFEIGNSKRYGVPGSLLIVEDTTLMVVKSSHGFISDIGYYDINSGQMTRRDLPAPVVAYRWELVLITGDKNYLPVLFKFEAPIAT